MEEKKLLLKIKSEFKIVYEILNKCSLFLLLLIILLIPSIIYKILFIYLIALVIIAITITLVVLFEKLKYKSYEYEFYEDKLIFNSNFINVENKYVKYENVKEIKYVQSLLQTFFNLGDIIINTNAENGTNNGVIIYNVKNPKNICDKINSILS